MQEVEVWVSIFGSYCAFNEMGFDVVYDITNNIPYDDYTLEELKELKYDGERDYKKVKAIKVGEFDYYVLWR